MDSLERKMILDNIPINRGISSRTNQVLVGVGFALSAIWGVGDTLGIPSDYMAYLDKGLTILGLVLGVHFRNKTTDKIEKYIKEKR